MAECLLEGAGEVNKGDWSSATVLLGLTPSILGMAAPTIEERLQLLRERPILGFLSILAAPSLTFSRPWIEPDHPDKKRISWIRQHTPGRAPNVYWIVVQYLSVALASANVVENTIRLGNQTIISWKCNMTYLELAWALLASVPPLVGLLRYFGPFSKKPKDNEALKKHEDSKIHGSRNHVEASETEETTVTKEMSEMKEASEKAKASADDKADFCEGLIDSCANICGLVHVVFGTIVLSSVQFVGTLDALGVVCRFTASALVAQFITMTQLYGKPDNLAKPEGFERLDRTNVGERIYGMNRNDLEKGA
jgi:hypothetical protein